jgi:hypothetical protein
LSKCNGNQSHRRIDRNPKLEASESIPFHI